ncbi:MAG: gamma-glutamyltransferase [Pyramidobacter sp.]|nr:gamma-glutamyltransferase [Pyramidobacter sp.]
MKKLAMVFTAASLVFSAAVSAGAVEVNEVYAEHGMVAAAHELASKAGVEIMQKGGNAIDAAVATALALNVVEFNASGIGGGGFTTIYSAKTKEIICLDYREQAPASATKDMFASEQAKKEKWSERGGKSIGVPGWLMGMDYALKNYGTMTFAEVAAPAIKLAEEGFTLVEAQKAFIVDNFENLCKYNDPDTLPFLSEGLPLDAGMVLKQPALAKLFRLIGEKGIDVFYKGEVGEAICKAVNNSGGKMTMEDLANYKMYVRTPMVADYRGYKIYSVPPASSGGVHIAQLLNIMENYDVKGMGFNSAKKVHIFSEATKKMFADRGQYMADTAYAKVPLQGLQSKEYAKKLAAEITDEVAVDVKPGDPWAYETVEKKAAYEAGMADEHYSTSSFSVADQHGNVVTSTNTINFFMGSTVFVPEYGFLLNDEMDDFSSNPNSVNAPEPGKRPLSAMSPSIVLDPQNRPFMSIGSPGATRILTAVAQIIMNVVDHGMIMDEAIEASRFHNQKGKALHTENDRADPTLVKTLEAMGYEVKLSEPLYLGGAQGIMFDYNTKDPKKFINGGADGRRLGVPVGF